jgi:hypothetical protein
MSVPAFAGPAPGSLWLRSARFDLFFVVGIPAISLGTALIVIWRPSLFWPILFVDLWLLGYHHVISTYT